MTEHSEKSSAAEGKTVAPTKELRIGLVLYGGVSLAVYINGVITEIWNALRASRNQVFREADNRPGGRTDTVYRDLLDALACHGGTERLEIVVDTVAGTSAGGINATALAKGVVEGGDLRVLNDMWIKKADVKQLKACPPRRLSRLRQSLIRVAGCAIDALGRIRHQIDALPGISSRWAANQVYSMLTSKDGTKTPLKGTYLTKMVASALQELASACRPLISDGQRFDLYVTRTDLHGWPRHLPVSRSFHRRSLYERKHAHVMRFAADDGGKLDDFALIYGARTTAGFPIAFAPVNVKAIADTLGGTRTCTVGNRHLREHELWDLDPDHAWMIDGGVLDNKPFGHVAKAIERKPAERQVYRTVVYVEPDPETEVESPPVKAPLPGAVMSGLYRIFRHEPIHDDLRQLRERNAKVARIREIADEAGKAASRAAEKLATPERRWPPSAESLEEWRLATNDALRHGDDPAYAGYVALKARRSARVFSELMCRSLNFPEDSRHAYFVRELIRTWLDCEGWTRPPEWCQKGGSYVLVEGQHRLLDAFDVPYRQRRMRALVDAANSQYQGAGNSDQGRRAALDAFKRKLAKAAGRVDQIEDLTPAEACEVKRLFNIKNSSIDEKIACLHDDTGRKKMVEQHRDGLRSLFGRIADRLRMAFRSVNEEIVDAVMGITDTEVQCGIATVYVTFPFVDRVVFPLMDSADVGDLIDVDVMRISPYDSELLSCIESPLQGRRLAAFAGFLKRSAREEDLVWGRLYAAERLVDLIARAAVPDECTYARLSGLRTEFKNKVMERILDDEGKRPGNSTRNLRNRVRHRLCYNQATASQHGAEGERSDHINAAKQCGVDEVALGCDDDNGRSGLGVRCSEFFAELKKFTASLAPLSVFLLGMTMWNIFATDRFAVSGGHVFIVDRIHIGISSCNTLSEEPMRTYMVAAAFMVLLLVEVYAMVFAIGSVWNGNGTASRRQRSTQRVAFTVAAAFFAILIIVIMLFIGVDQIDAIGWSVFENTIGCMKVEFPAGSRPDYLEYLLFSVRDKIPSGPGFLSWLVGLINVGLVGAVVASASIISASCTISPRVSHGGIQLTSAVIEVAEQNERLKRYLGLAALLMLIGVAFAALWSSWPLAFSESKIAYEEGIAERFAHTVNGTVFFLSCLYTLVLAAMFIPIATRLRRAAVDLADRKLGSCTPVERRAWMIKNGLALSIGEAGQRIGAILAPILVPVVSAVGSLLAGG